MQLVPSPLFVVGSGNVGGGLRWQVTPFLYSFGVAAKPVRAFVVEPVARHAGAIELYASPEWACTERSPAKRRGAPCVVVGIGRRATYRLAKRLRTFTSSGLTRPLPVQPSRSYSLMHFSAKACIPASWPVASDINMVSIRIASWLPP